MRSGVSKPPNERSEARTAAEALARRRERDLMLPRIALSAERIGTRVRQARKALDLDQVELATIAGVNPRTVSQIENGKVTTRLDVLLRVLDSLGLDIEFSDRSTKFGQPGGEAP